jgi:hypothetical protein
MRFSLPVMRGRAQFTQRYGFNKAVSKSFMPAKAGIQIWLARQIMLVTWA